MKNTLKTALCMLIVASFLLVTGVVASAEDGFVFDVKGFNQTIWGEDAVLVTSNEAYQTCNPKWAISVVCNVVSDKILKVAKDPVAGAGDIPGDVKLKDNQVVLVVHSSTSDPEQASQYPNVYGKLAALDLKKGHYLVLSDGLDLATASGSGTVTVVEKEKNLPKTDDPVSEEPSEDEPESSEEPEPEPESSEEPEPEPSEEPSEAAPEPSADEQPSQDEPASEAPSAEPVSENAQESAEAPAENSGTILGMPIWLFIVLLCVIAIAVAVLIALMTKKKK